MKKTLLFTAVSLATISTSFGAWVWVPPSNNTTNVASGESGNFTFTAVGADYDINNAVDGTGFDQAPTPTSFSWSSNDGQEISITLSADGEFFVFNLDADNDDVLPSSVSLNVRYSTPITERGRQFGAVGGGLNPLNLTLDHTLTALDANLNEIGLSSSNVFVQNRSPSSFTGNTAVFNDVPGIVNNGSARFYGLGNHNPMNGQTPVFEFGSADTIGGLNLTFSDFSGGEEFRISFDGGVAAVPEPSVTLFGSLAMLALLHRKRRH